MTMTQPNGESLHAAQRTMVAVGLATRLRALAATQESFAARYSWHGNAKYGPSADALEQRETHRRAADDLRAAADAIEELASDARVALAEKEG